MISQKTRNLIAFAYLSLIGCIAVGFLWRTITGALSGTLFFHAGQGSYTFIDFVAFYSAGKIVLSDLRSQIYQAPIQLQFYNSTIAPWHVSVDRIPLGQSVPWFFAMTALFSVMPLVVSFFCWNIVGAALCAWGLHKLLLQNGHDNRFSALFLLCFAGSYPLQWLLKDGQNSWFLLAPLCLFFYGWFANRDIACGVGLALLTIKPQYALFLLIPALVSRRWKAVGTCACIVAVFLLASTALFGVDAIRQYPALLQATERTDPAVFPTWMISLRGPLSIVLPKDTALALSTGVYAAALAAIAYFWYRLPRGRSDKERIGMAITVLACLVTSPHTHIYDLVIFAACAAITPLTGWFAAGSKNLATHLWCRTLIIFPFVSFLVYILTELKPYGEVVGVSFFVIDCWLLFLAIWMYRSTPAVSDLTQFA